MYFTILLFRNIIIEMRQQNKIQLNFQQIFADQSFNTNLSNSFHYPLSQNQYQQPHYSVILQESTYDISHNGSRIKGNLNKQIKGATSAVKHIQKLTKLIQQKQMPQIKRKNVDINELTAKLHNAHGCHRIQCYHHKSTIEAKEDADLLQTQRFKLSSRYKNNDSFSKTNRSLPTFERLHNLNKLKELKNVYLQQQSTESTCKLTHQRSKTSAIVKSYLKNYVPFYQRLDHVINQSQERIKIVQKNPQFASGNLQKYFKPRLIPSKYSRVQSKYNKEVVRELKSNQLRDFLNSSINTSFSSLDRSLDIVNKVEQHFFSKMKCIFVNNESDLIEVDQNIINLLTQTEFKILQGFIMNIDSETMRGYEFEDKLRDYYNALPIYDKHELRSHETSKKIKYSQIKKSSLRTSHNSMNQCKHLSNVKLVLPVRTNKKRQGNYHRKIGTYI